MPDIDYANSALGAVATAQTEYAGFPATLGNDGNDLTYWRSVNQPGAPWWEVDLGAPQYITSIHVKPYLGAQIDGVWTLSASNDGVNYDVIVQNIHKSTEATYQVGGAIYQIWRLTYTIRAANQYTGMYTVQIIGPTEAPPPPANTNCDHMQAWLDGLEAYWVPCVQTWLDAN